MGEPEIVSRLNRGRTQAASLDEFFRSQGEGAWGPLRDTARASPGLFDDRVVDWIAAHVDDCPRAAFSAFLDLAARDEKRREPLVARFRELMAGRHEPALAAAGYNLHEYCRLLDERWVADARVHFDANPEGAWGIITSAAYYRPALLTPEIVDAFEERRAAAPVEYFRTMLALAANDPARAEDLLARALRRFDEHPAAAIEALPGVAREPGVHRPELFAAALRHLPANPEKAWEFFGNAAYETSAPFDGAVLDALERVAAGPLFGILHRVADKDPARARDVMARFARLLPAHAAAGIGEAHYVAVNDAHLLTPALVDAVCGHFAADPYQAFDVVHAALDRRPELVGRPHIDAAVANIRGATNWAFGFFRRALELRPEFTPTCTLALFECLAHEPPNRATTRVEELQAIVTIAQASHVKTELERALRQPPGVGSKRARALMAILFRQGSRSKQHVLFEALRLAATACTWSNRNDTPLWDFFLLLLDHSTGDAVSTAAAERFLEGAFQLTYLMERGADHDTFREQFAAADAGPLPWPGAVDFLAGDAELDRLYRIVKTLGSRVGIDVRLSPVREFEGRAKRAEIERQALERELGGADGERRRRLEKRLEGLTRRLAFWADPAYARAFRDAEGEARLPSEARSLLRQERRDLGKGVADALRAELERIAVEAVERSRLGLYGSKLEAALGRKVDVTRVDPSILPAFLFFGALGSLSKNRAGLARLIDDRLEGRPHDWMWNEPEVLEWKERVRQGQTGVVFERWRGRFSKEFHYRPQDAVAEKKRRVKEDLAQTRRLLEGLGAEGLKDSSVEELARALAALKAPRAEEEKDDAPPPPDPQVVEEIEMNLERVRIVLQTPESDYEGRITLEVETDPFQVLFMGEYGFASCLSLRGSNVWSAVSNAIDIDKAVVWAKESGGNVVGRRLIALTPAGVVSYRTYANRHGLSLDGMFEEFIEAYARHCGTRVTRGGSPGPLLSDRWYDDGAI